MIDRIAVFSPVADGNTAGTGAADWTGSGGGVQPPYSSYAPPHLAQPAAYPMHLPHDPMVSDSSCLSLICFPFSHRPDHFSSTRSSPKKRSITRVTRLLVPSRTPTLRELGNRHAGDFPPPESSRVERASPTGKSDRLKPKRATLPLP